jgi:putative nucleotidyltransferase with HDIG domain
MAVETRQKPTLDRLRERLDQLPVLPTVVVDLLRLDPNAEDYFERVAALIRADPAFAAKLLRYANSAAVSRTHAVNSVETALMLTGARGAVNLIVGQSAAQVFLPHHEWERSLWRHATDVASLMQALAPRVAGVRIDPDKAYLFGLLHDIGRFVLYLEAPEELRIVDETEWETPEALIKAEQSICGFTHAELGFLALRKWALPEAFALAVRHHHSANIVPTDVAPGDLPLVRLLQDADWIAVKLALRADLWRTMPAADLRAMLVPARLHVQFNLTPDDLAALVRQALASSERIQQSLALALPPAETPGSAGAGEPRTR